MDMDTPRNPSECKTRHLSSRNSDLSQASSVATTTDGYFKEAKRKLAPNKAPVGLAKSPDLKNCKSKVGSLHNIKHKPTGGNVTIQTKKFNWNAKSKIGSLENKEHKPAGGNVKVESRKLEWNTSSKVQSLANINHKSGGGNVKIFNETYHHKSARTSDNKKQSILDFGATTTSESQSTSNRRPTTAVVARGTRPRDAAARLTSEMKNLNLKEK